MFFRPIGGGIIEATMLLLHLRVPTPRSSALLGAASLKRARVFTVCDSSGTFFRPIGGGIIEAELIERIGR